VHDFERRVHQDLSELHEVAQPLLPHLALGRVVVPRGHLRALLPEDGQVTLDLHHCLGDHVRREASDEGLGGAIGGRLLLLFDQRIEARDLLRRCPCIASRLLSAWC
jgi:hypothetical protein